jgi:hypothetical protein
MVKTLIQSKKCRLKQMTVFSIPDNHISASESNVLYFIHIIQIGRILDPKVDAREDRIKHYTSGEQIGIFIL